MLSSTAKATVFIGIMTNHPTNETRASTCQTTPHQPTLMACHLYDAMTAILDKYKSVTIDNKAYQELIADVRQMLETIEGNNK